MVLVDSGAFTHVCPESFVCSLPVRRSTSKREALTADGRPLRRYAERDVTLVLEDGATLDATFQ
eukprot:13276034-Heterocapsa_arctica.AAC.1